MYAPRDAKLDQVNSILLSAQDHFCPVETFKVRLGRHPMVSARLARLSKLKSLEFKKHCYSQRFKDLKKQCKAELRMIKQKRINAAVEAGEGSNSWLGRLESLLDPEGKTNKNAGLLPEHRIAG